MNVDSAVLNIGSFCSGVGLLDIAVKLACEYHGIRTRAAFACEWDSYAAAVLRSRMEDEALESCPIWCGDLRRFPAKSFRGVVDAAVFGFPCQDISCAGRGEGIRGTRSGVFFDILAAVCEMGCRVLFMENVGSITVRGLDVVLGSLAELGFAAEWTCLTASAVGAAHKRERWFCVANSSRFTGRERPGWQRVFDCNSTVADSQCERREQIWDGHGQDDRQVAGPAHEDMGDSERSRWPSTGSGRQKHTGTAVERSGLPLFAPGPGGDWCDIPEWLWPATEPGVRMLAHGVSVVVDQSRADQLRCAGNGVVVAQAYCAYIQLMQRLT